MIETRRTPAWLGFVLVAVMFCAPLLVGLGATDMRNDEAIYWYAVERILDTGEWLTPRLIPNDWPFYEKPPLKFWMVAGGIRAGLLPRDERGMRLLDALFGIIAFTYIYWLGWELAGVICGIVALFVLFTLDPIVFDHGVRSNNMEGALVLSYCGGMFHFARWRLGEGRRSTMAHAFAVAGYFTLAFMTKFVAALFLPVVCVVTLLWGKENRQRLFQGWRDWILPSLAAVVLICPWFIYETVHDGHLFWAVIFGEHVFTRFTSSLDPSHLRPWNFYFTQTWKELLYGDTRIVAGAGIVMLAAAAFRRQWFLARLVVVWGIVPFVLISIGTSKLIHYAYPFWPAIGLAAGYAAAVVAGWIDDRVGPRVAGSFNERFHKWGDRPSTRPIRRALIGMALAALALAVWTAVVGPVDFAIGGFHVFRNGKILRPIIFAGLFGAAGGYATTVTQTFGILALCLVLPFRTYEDKIHKLTRVDHPLRSIRDCAAGLKPQDGPGPGVLDASQELTAHPYYYYFWRLGPWVSPDAFSPADVVTHLTVPGKQTPVIIATPELKILTSGLDNPGLRTGPGWPPLDPATVARVRAALAGGVMTEDHVMVLLPGPFRVCVSPAIEGGGKPLPTPPAAGRLR